MIKFLKWLLLYEKNLRGSHYCVVKTQVVMDTQVIKNFKSLLYFDTVPAFQCLIGQPQSRVYTFSLHV